MVGPRDQKRKSNKDLSTVRGELDKNKTKDCLQGTAKESATTRKIPPPETTEAETVQDGDQVSVLGGEKNKNKWLKKDVRGRKRARASLWGRLGDA